MSTLVTTGSITITDVMDGAKGDAGVNGNTIAPNLVYNFTGTKPTGFGLTSCTDASSNNGTTVTFTASTGDSNIITPSFSLSPANNYIIAIRVKIPIGASIDGSLYYSNTNHGFTELNKLLITGLAATGEWQDLIIDASLASVDYMTGGNITSFRFDFLASASTFDLAYISIGKYGTSKAIDPMVVTLSNETSSFPAPVSGYVGITFTGGNCDVTAAIGETVLTPVAIPGMTSANYPASLVTTTGVSAVTYTAGTGTLVCDKATTTISAVNGNSFTSVGHPFTFTGVIYNSTGTLITGLTNFTAYVAFKVDANTFNLASGTLTAVSAFVSGGVYYIGSIGTTTQLEWNALANTSNVTYAAGNAITCLTPNTGLTTTGKAYAKLTTITNTSLPTGTHSLFINNWDCSGYTSTGYTGGAKLTFSSVANTYVMVGLSTNAALNSAYTSINYALHVSGTNLYVFESGTNIGVVGSNVLATDILSVIYNNDTVRYYRNGICLRSVDVASGLTFYMDSSFLYPNSILNTYITGLRFGAYADTGTNSCTVDIMLSNAVVAVGTISGNIYSLLAPSSMTASAAYVDVLITGKNELNQFVPAVTKRINYSLARTGATGISARRAFTVSTSATPPATITAGTGDVVPTTSGLTWSFTATSSLTAGQYMYQVDGLYTSGGNTTWGAAYLSNLKVGSLSALAVDTGVLTIGTGGSISSGKTSSSSTTAGFWIGNDTGASVPKLAIGDVNKSLTWNGTDLVVDGDIISTGNINNGAVTTMTTYTSTGIWLNIPTPTVVYANTTTQVDGGTISGINLLASVALPSVDVATIRLISFSGTLMSFNDAGDVELLATTVSNFSTVLHNVRTTPNNSLSGSNYDSGGTARGCSYSSLGFTFPLAVAANTSVTLYIGGRLHTGRNLSATAGPVYNWSIEPKIFNLLVSIFTGKR
jgi:hypothetical protein